MRADTCILLLYLPLAIFGGKAEKNESTFVATHEWQTVKKGEYLRRAPCPTGTTLYAETRLFVRHHVSQIRRTSVKYARVRGRAAETRRLSRRRRDSVLRTRDFKKLLAEVVLNEQQRVEIYVVIASS